MGIEKTVALKVPMPRDDPPVNPDAVGTLPTELKGVQGGFGSAGRTRTYDPPVNSRLLYR